MNWFKNTYNKIYFGFILSILIVFFLTRPLNSPYNKFIDGDGLGYYVYLPATYIYNDTNFEFKWFNEVHKKNYVNSSTENPSENFLSLYKGKYINKYYQGLSFLWLPFFTISHLVAKIIGYPADGFSLPYQLGIGFASLLYLFLGLFFLKKLLVLLFKNELVSILVPITIFYGTHLFNYSIQLNSQSHVYSFTFVTLFIYSAYLFFNQTESKLKWFLLTGLFLIIICCIRPLNGLIIFITPALIPKQFFKTKYRFEKIKFIHLHISIAILGALFNQFSILYAQTHSFIANTYSGDKFHFTNPKLFQTVLGYNAGLFVYVPIACISFFGILYLENIRQKIIFPFVFILILYIYSSWWYWTITPRTLIDYYPILAILLAALLTHLSKSLLGKILAILILCLNMSYYQLKNYQIHNGILDEFYTHKEMFWNNFFKTTPSNLYSIPPSTILKQELHFETFETDSYTGRKSKYYKKEGNYSAVLDSISPFSKTFDYGMPSLFKNEGIKQIRFSFWCYFTEKIKSIQIYFKFYNKENKLLSETPFYITPDKIQIGKWEYKEFGHEVYYKDLYDAKNELENIDHVSIFIWNTESKNEAYIDDVKTEFILTNRDYEIIK